MKLSVYYVVKNEIRSLPESLQYTLQFADEIVVVDTGSTDGTKEFLMWLHEKENCRVVDYDFITTSYDASVARNYAKKLCTGDWILALDGDEFITAQDGTKLKHRLLENSGFDALELPVFNFLEHPKYKKHPFYLQGQTIRVFKNHPDFSYQYCIHPILNGCKSVGFIQDVPINHYQFLEAEHIEEKTAFRIKQMTRKIKQQGYTFINCIHFSDIFRRKFFWTGHINDIRKSVFFMSKALKINNNKHFRMIYNQLVLQLKELETKNGPIKSNKNVNKKTKGKKRNTRKSERF